MPFHRPAQDGSFGQVHYCWRLHPAEGHAISGDGLFAEMGRVDGHLLFLLVDATGHGAEAGAVVRLLQDRLLVDRSCSGLAPDELLRRLHGMLQPVWALTERFVAALAVLVAGREGALRASAAGTPRPWHRAPAGTWDVHEVAGGMLLGAPFEGSYEQTELELGPGGLLLAFSDGLNEARDPQGNQYGQGPLRALLCRLPHEVHGPGLLESLLADVRAHVGPPWPQDDTTLLCLWRPPGR